jgi:hypothetical protein
MDHKFECNQTKKDTEKEGKKLGFVYHQSELKEIFFYSINASVAGNLEVFQFGDLKSERKICIFKPERSGLD